LVNKRNLDPHQKPLCWLLFPKIKEKHSIRKNKRGCSKIYFFALWATSMIKANCPNPRTLLMNLNQRVPQGTYQSMLAALSKLNHNRLHIREAWAKLRTTLRLRYTDSKIHILYRKYYPSKQLMSQSQALRKRKTNVRLMKAK
jgi:hypothetical protein